MFLDIEITGLGDNAQAIEIAIVDGDGVVIFESYCRPTVPVEPDAQAIHGISTEKLAEAPRACTSPLASRNGSLSWLTQGYRF